MKTFVEKYDTVTTPSGEGEPVRKEMTVQVEQWWNSSDVARNSSDEDCEREAPPPSDIDGCVVYYESIKRDLEIKPIHECRCDERIQTKTKRFTRLVYTLRGRPPRSVVYYKSRKRGLKAKLRSCPTSAPK